MELQLKDFGDFGSWQEAKAFLSADPCHFLKTKVNPPGDLDPDLKARIIVQERDRRSRFVQVPHSAGEALIRELCGQLLDQAESGTMRPDLADVAAALEEVGSREHHWKELAEAMVAKVRAWFSAEAAILWTYRHDEKKLRIEVGQPADMFGAGSETEGLPSGKGIAGWVVKHNQAFVPETLTEHGVAHQFEDDLLGRPPHDVVAVPVRMGHSLYGVLEIINRQVLPANDPSLLRFVAAILALMAENSRKHAREQDFMRATVKAEIASSVLHNIANILSSLNVSISIVQTKLLSSKLEKLLMAHQLIEEKKDSLGAFFTQDPKGKLLPQFFLQIGQRLESERQFLLRESRKITANAHLMREMIETQQTLAKAGSDDAQNLSRLIDEALSVQREYLQRQGVTVKKHYATVRPVQCQKGKLAHVLINLIKNGVEAMDEVSSDKRILSIVTGEDSQGRVSVKITDRGIGLSSDVLNNLFTHGFTTKPHGHGFGLAYCAQAMEEMNGEIDAHSPGPGKGATFTLRFPSAGDGTGKQA